MKQASQQWLQCQRLLGMHNQAYVHVQAVAELTPEEGFLFLW